MLIQILIILLFIWIILDLPLIIYIIFCLLRKKSKKIKDVNFFVSILIPCYNEEKYIKKCLFSVSKQSYKNYEVIIIDDNSKDNSLKLIKEFISKNKLKNFKISSLNENIGRAKALNIGLKKAKGELIVLLDADTILNENSLKNIISYFDKDVGSVSGNIQTIQKENNLINKFQEIEYALSQEVFRYAQGISGNCIIIPGAFCAYKKEYIDKIEDETLSEDFDTSSKILSKGLKTVFAEDAIAYTAIPQNLIDVISQRLRWQQGGFEVVSKYLLKFPRNSTKFWYFWFIFSVLQGSLLRMFILTLLPLYIIYSKPTLIILLAHIIYTNFLYAILIITHNHKYKKGKIRNYFGLLPALTIYYFSIFAFATYLGVLCAIKGNKEWLKIRR